MELESSRLLLFESGAAVGIFNISATTAAAAARQAATHERGALAEQPEATRIAVVMEPPGSSFTHVRQVRSAKTHTVFLVSWFPLYALLADARLSCRTRTLQRHEQCIPVR